MLSLKMSKTYVNYNTEICDDGTPELYCKGRGQVMSQAAKK
jgi:hypothetical protein